MALFLRSALFASAALIFSQPTVVQSETLTLASGINIQDLYVENCSICHGATGMGDGALATQFTPPPRNFVFGSFRYRSTGYGEPPAQNDLVRTITMGIEGSYGRSMPAFDTLSSSEILALAGLVGELAGLREFGVPVEIPPRPIAKNVDLGRKLFQENGCTQCHGDSGDGQGTLAGELADESNSPILPANLTEGIYKGGATPEDIFLRLKYGIDGTPMPSFGRSLSTQDLWALTDFVLELGGSN